MTIKQTTVIKIAEAIINRVLERKRADSIAELDLTNEFSFWLDEMDEQGKDLAPYLEAEQKIEKELCKQLETLTGQENRFPLGTYWKLTLSLANRQYGND